MPAVTDELWDRIQPLLPVRPRRFRYPGRKPLDDRQVLNGILFVLVTGIGWGAPAPRARLRLRHDLLAQVAGLERGRGLGSAPPAPARRASRGRPARLVTGAGGLQPCAGHRGGDKTGPSPVDRGRLGSKHHLITDANGLPLACVLTAANVNDITQLLRLVDAIPPVRGRPGRPRRRPDAVVGDRGYDSDPHRRALWQRGVRPELARRGGLHAPTLGQHRWRVERSLSWLHQFRRLRIRWEFRSDMHEAFLRLACCMICWRRLEPSLC
jgi:transposase